MSETFLFTSESVCEGHPDKLCDIVSDSILDACLKEDPNSRVACETCAKTGFVICLGEITTQAKIDYQTIVRKAVLNIGYNSDKVCFNGNDCSVLIALETQSPEIYNIVYETGEAGAGDQGIMFGYATDETPEMMPLTISLAHALAKRLSEARRSTLDYLGPDGKTQVTIEYEKKDNLIKPIKVHTVLVSAMHSEKVTLEQLREDIKREIIDPVLPKDLVKDDIRIIINRGPFTLGGPKADAGLTGRKIIVDGYGGWGSYGGGCFSGKDPSKVDRSASYAARWVAKSIVAAGYAKRCLVQLSYAIGSVEPISINVDTFGTGTKTNQELLDIIVKNFDLSPAGIIRDLKLRRPIYAKTAAYGHFGRNDPDFTWEIPKSLI